MFCPNCGNQIAEGAKFCGSCGTPVAVVTPVTEEVKQEVESVSEEIAQEVENVAEDVAQEVENVAEDVAQEVENVSEEVKAELEGVSEEVSQEVDNVSENVEAAMEAVDVEEAKADFESEVDTSLDESILEALETPEIPESEVSFEETKEEEPAEEGVPESWLEYDYPEEEEKQPETQVTPVVPVTPVAPVTPAAPVTPVAQTVAPVMGTPVISESTDTTPVSGRPVKEAFKFLSLIGIIIALAGCFLDAHKLNDWAGTEYVARTDKMYEFTYGWIMLGGLAIALVLILIKKSAFALSGVVAALVAYGLFVNDFYIRQMDTLKMSEIDFSFGIGSFVMWAGLVLALAGLFVKIGKKPLFKI